MFTRKFGPTLQPRLQVGAPNKVEVDLGGQAQLATYEDFAETVRVTTWRATLKYVKSLRDRQIRIAFFNSTPQGGGVALMRHALIRLFRVVGLEVSW
jgi:alpha,alpha-trehalose phosphorylase (configuration-retaining)